MYKVLGLVFFLFLFRKRNNSFLFYSSSIYWGKQKKKHWDFCKGIFFLLNRFFPILFFDLVTQLCKQYSFLYDSFFFNLPTVGTSANGWTVFFSSQETEVLHSGVL
jgi:hypothetical protein